VQIQDNKSPEDIFVNEIDSDIPNIIYKVTCKEKISCNCGFYETTGMICRHIFFICTTENSKDVSKLRIFDRWIVSLEEISENHFTAELLQKIKEKSC